MALANLNFPKEFSIDGSLALKRDVLLKKFLVLLNVFMLPLSIFWLMNDREILGCSLLLFLGAYNTNVAMSILKRPFLIAYPIVMMTLSLTLFVAVYTVGFSAALWTYPIIIAIYFIIPLRGANYSNVLIVMPIIIIVFIQQDLSLAIRYLGSIGATFVLGIYLVNTIVELQQQLFSHSTTDPLTGAYNRRQMDTILNTLIKRYVYEKKQHVILMLDVDYFKHINDAHGHDIGDIALQDLVNVLKSNIRKTDDVFRMGGEEFIILLRDTQPTHAISIAESIRKVIAQVLVKNSTQTLSVSIGVSMLTSKMTYSQWLGDADRCLYEAKRSGRNKVVYQVSTTS